MKSFVFRLERVLQLRAREERERARALGDAVQAEAARRAALRAAESQLGEVHEQMKELPGGALPAGVLQSLGLTLDAAQRQIEDAREAHEQALGSVDAEQGRYGTARRERRVVERLREIRLTAWRGDVSRREQQETDGDALRRHRPGEDPT